MGPGEWIIQPMDATNGRPSQGRAPILLRWEAGRRSGWEKKRLGDERGWETKTLGMTRHQEGED